MPVELLESEGLRRKIKFSLAAQPILESVEKKIQERAQTFKMPGFREGKVPLNIIRKKIGAEVLSKAVEHSVDNSLKTYFDENNITLAAQPKVEIISFDDKSELIFEAEVELLPELPKINWEEIEVEAFEIDITDEDLKHAHQDILSNFKNFSKAEEGASANSGDAVIINFVGKIDGEEFEGGKGEGIKVEIGSNQFIPGFEDQLIGSKAGEKKIINITFPNDYSVNKLAGKPATFDIMIIEVLKHEAIANMDDSFAAKLGIESMDKLNEMIKERIKMEFNSLTRLKTKKLLFDILDTKYKFEVPESMFKLDFEMMWNEVKKQNEKNPDAFNKPIDELEQEYRKLALRRVRIGVLLAGTAKENNIKVEEIDLKQAIQAEAMQRPGQEKSVIDFYRDPNNVERLKGPILEEKAVDFILTKVKTNIRKITSKEFFKNYSNELTDPK